MGEKTSEQFYLPPPKVGKWESCRIFMWNPETGQFLGRTCGSWAKILLFYLIFYACLCGFFAAMLAIFYQTLDKSVPKWQQASSLIGNNPGLGFRPMPPGANVESTLIWYKQSDPKNAEMWIKELDIFLQPYYDTRDGKGDGAENIVDCDFSRPPPHGKVCRVKPDSWAPCSKQQNYGYVKGNPCIFLKINKIYGWIPEYFNNSVDLPKDMPEDIKGRIKNDERKFAGGIANQALNHVWVSCEGEYPADKENIGPIQYLPDRGFPSYYFPFKNIKGYLSPVVAIHFERPQTGVLINIECKAWARNIHHDRAERRGSVHFEVLID